MEISFSLSGGHGGQNVNKRDTKAVLKWHVGNSAAFSPEEKRLIRERLTVTGEDTIVLHCDEERSQPQNKAACIERLHQKVHEAIQVQAERKETKKPRGVRAREVQEKKNEGKKKKLRGRVDWHE